MSKTHSRMTKSLSVLLCTLMILSTVCFFNPFPALRANATVDVTKTLSAKESNDVTFNVPESIYLKPGSSNFEFFLANNVSSKGAAVIASATSSVTVSASSPYAENMKLSYTIESTGKKADGNSVAISGKIQKNGADIATVESTSAVSLSLDSSNTFSGYSDALQGSEAFIKWALTYTVKGTAHTIYAYTSIYIPYLGQAGMSAHARHNGTYANPENWTYSFITGGHSVTGGAASSKFLSNEAVNKEAKGASDAVFVAPLVMFTGGNAGKSRENVEYPFSNGGTVPWGSNFYADAFTAKANGGVALKTQTDGKTNYNPYADSDLGSMKITVDTSRFANYNQIPNLSAGWAQFRHDWDGGASRLMWISGVNGTSASGVSESGLTGAAITTNADTSKYEGYVSLAKGLYALNGAVTAGDHLMVFGYRNAYSPYVGNDSITRTFAGVKLNVAVTNKTALRDTVFSTLYRGYSKDMSATYGSEFENAMSNASKVLADQFATASDVSNATDKLNTVLQNCREEMTVSLNEGRTSVNIYAVVPETIYLKPNASSMTSFEYYLNNTLSNGIITPVSSTPATTGSFLFECKAATKVRIIVSNSDVSSFNVTVNGTSVNLAGSLSSATAGQEFVLSDGRITGTIIGGTMKSAVAQSKTKSIEWKFIYTLEDGTTSEYISTYTVAYAPYLTPIAAGAQTRNRKWSGKTYTRAASVLWVTGIQSINDGTAYNMTQYTASSKIGTRIGTALVGVSCDTSSDTNVDKNPDYVSDSGIAAYSYENEGDGTTSGRSRNATSPYGYLLYDSSRFKNLNQIPDFKIGFSVIHSSGAVAGNWNVYDCSSDGVAATGRGEGGSSGFSVLGTILYGQSFDSGNYKYSTTESYYNKGIKVNNQAWDRSISGLTSRSTVSVRGIYVNTADNGVGNHRTPSITQCNVILDPVNKTDLREAVQNALKPGYQDDWMKSFNSSTYAQLLKAACETLGNPTATQNDVNSATNNLNGVARDDNRISETAKATHRALVKTVSANGTVSGYNKVADIYLDKAASVKATNESKTYEGSDNVMISANDFAGYTYKGYKRFGATVFPNGSYDSTNRRELYLRVGKSLQSSGKDNLVFFYEAPDANLSIDLDGGVYPVDKLNTEITASTGSTFTVQNPTKEGYTFVSWRLDGAGKLSGGTYTFGLGDGKLTAVWEPVPTQSAELIVDPDGGTMSSDLVYITNGAASASGNNGNGTLTYNITEGDGAQSLNISGHYKGFTYGEANATGERTQIIPVWVYLEAGKSYTISWTDDNAITEFFLFKNGDLKTRTHFNPGTAGAHSFTFTAGEDWTFASDDNDATGWYQLRLDQNMPVAAEGQPANEGDYNITGLSVKSNGDARLGYRQAAETTVFISEPVRDGYKFAGWSGLVNGSISRVDPDETNVNGGYLYTFKGKADTLVAQWTDAVYEIGFDNLFLATAWAEDKYTSASNDTVGFDKDNDIITYKNNKNADDQTDTEARRAESSYRITGLTPGKEYSLSFDFASNMTGSSANDCNTYVFAHFYDENGTQINIKNTAINYGDVVSGENTYVGKYIINYTDASGKAQTQITPSEWAGSNSRIFSGLQMYDVTVKDGYGHSDIIFTVPEGTESMDIAFGAQHAGQTVSFKNVQINEYDRVNPVTDYSRVQKSYGRDTSVFGELATAKKLGYDFNGWFTGENGTGTRITASTSTAPYHTKFTVWSNWTEIEYTVTCDAAGGTLAGGTVNPTKYTINTEKITVAAAPTKQGYIFKGWKITKDTSVHSDNNWTEETVAAGREYTGRMYGDVKLTAVWEENAAAVKATVREQNADGTYTDTVVINGNRLDGSVVDLANYIGAKTGFKAVVITNSGKAFALNNGRFTVVGGQNYDILIQRDREQYTFTVKYVMSDGSTAPAAVTKTLRFGQSDSVTSPVITGYTPDRTVATVDAITENTEVTVTYTLDKHNVTVHYVYENGTKAADDKTLTVEYGKTYSIDSPKITGYTADQAIVSGKMGTGDITVTVKYTVNSHKLTIIYKYSENEHPETKQEYTFKYGEKYNYSVPPVEGFTASQSTVDGTMGDGDVTVTVTYTIITFTVTFKDWDGRLLKEENVKWNANATAPADPSRDGYTFKGWDKAFSNIKANTEVTALYDINTYTLSFDANGGSAVSDIKQAYATAVTAPSTTRTGYTFVKWTGDDGSEVPSIMPARNINFTASWTANKYTIAFDANNGTGTTASVNATYDADAVLTANGFTRTGFSFAGWNTAKDGSGTAYADKATVRNLASENGAKATLYAQWTANSYTVTYRVDGNETAKQTYKYGETIKAIADPVKTGYTFMGWKETLPAAMPANDITVDAIFEVNTYTLTYTVDGAFYKSFEVKYGEAITATAEPAKTGYTFSGWNGVPSTMPANDVTVTGTFTVNSYKLTFMSDGKVYDEKTYDFGADVTAPAAPTKTGYTFAGWDKEIPAAMPAENTVITAKWIPASDTSVKVEYYVESLTGEYVLKNTLVDSATTDAEYTAEIPAYDGFTFDAANSVITGIVKADSSLVLTVRYSRNTYTLSYTVDGKAHTSLTYKFGETVTPAAAPEKTGYTFSGWQGVPETMPANDVEASGTFTANTYYIAFDSNGGTGTMEKQRFTYDTAAKLAKNTFTKTDSVFVGWNTASDGSGYGYADEAEVGNLTSANDVTVTLYAQYKADKNNNGIPDDEETPWTVTYAAGEGGKLLGASSEAVLDGMKPVSVPEASANSGYAFRFWVDGDGVKVVPSAAVIRANTEFTAVFGVDANGNGTADEDEGKFTVTYDMNGAKLTELVLSGLTPEDVPSKDKANESKPDGKCFAYWTLNGEKVEPSAETVTADTTFVAVYTDDLNGDGIPDSEQKHYTVTYNGGEHGTLSGDTTVTVVENLAYSKAWEPAVTPDKGYMFKGWSNVPEKITDDVVITAIYGDDKNGNGKEDGTDEDPFCTVTFIDWNGEVIKTERILNGMSAAEAAPEGLTRGFDDDNHYTFDGWDKDITVITSDTNVTAQYTAAAHAYGEWTVTDKPTCTSFGTKERKCDCGKIETAQVEKAAHTPAEAVTENAVAATCETDGSHDEVVYCSVCGHEISRVNVVDKAAGHKAEKVAGKAATCTEPGLSDGEKCSVCGKTITEQTETPALGHDWGAWKVTVKPTYTSTGVAKCECARCGVTEEKELPPYVHGDDYLEIVAPAVIRAGSIADIKAVRMPEEVIESDAVWTTGDASVISVVGGKLYAVGEGTVTLTATTADGKLTAEKTVTVVEVDMDNARIIKFVNMRKMDYTVAGFYKIYNDGSIYWSRESECPFTVYTYTTFNYPDYIVYLDGKAVQADENGVYHIPAGTKNVIVSMAGAVDETPTQPDGDGSGSGTGTKVSFWEMILRFFRKLFSIFKKK